MVLLRNKMFLKLYCLLANVWASRHKTYIVVMVFKLYKNKNLRIFI